MYLYEEGVKYRQYGWNDEQPKKIVSWAPGSKRSLFGIHLWDTTPTTVYLTEGETDTMKIHQCLSALGKDSYLVLGLGGKPSLELWGKWLSIIYEITGDGTYDLVTCFDNDIDGDAYRATVDELYQGPIKTLIVPPEYKDICEALDVVAFSDLELVGYQLPDDVIYGEALSFTLDDATRNYESTGYKLLDILVGGYCPGRLTVIAGPPKSGKSSFTCQLVVNYIRQYRKPVMFIPLELNIQDTLMMLAAIWAGIPLDVITPEALLAAADEIRPYLYMVKHFGYMDIDRLAGRLTVLKKKGIEFFVLDHITALATSFSEGLTTQLIDAAISLIQSRLNEYGVAGIVVSHTNNSAGDVLTPSSLRGSLALCQLPSVVLGVRRLEEGLSDVYTILPSRFVGKMGKVTFEYEGCYKPLVSKRSTF